MVNVIEDDKRQHSNFRPARHELLVQQRIYIRVSRYQEDMQAMINGFLQINALNSCN